jgi:hypothetical protein
MDKSAQSVLKTNNKVFTYHQLLDKIFLIYCLSNTYNTGTTLGIRQANLIWTDA